MATRIVDLGSVVGPQGPAGEAGEPGTPGAAGAAGKNAYQYAMEGGYSGTETQFKAKLAKEYLPLGGGDMAGIIDMNNKVITGLPSPVAPSDAVNYQTLIDAIAGASAFALIKISGKDGYGQDTYYRTAAGIERIDTYGTDTVLRINKTVSRPVDMYYATSVAVELPAQFKFPSSDWSDIGSYTPLTAGGNRMGANNENGKVVLKYVGTISNSSFSIDGYVKVGVNA